MNREEIQKEALDAWITNDCNGALILGTGVGKTKIAIDAIVYSIKQIIKDNTTSRILWLTNSERLRDSDTPNDFEKWDKKFIWDEWIKAECIQTAYKWQDTKWDLVIADEGDFMLTPEYSKFFENNTYSHILFLTATIDKYKQEMLDAICPVVYRYTTSEAQSDGILNKSTITMLKFMLDDKDKYIEAKGKGGKVFYQTENAAYEYLEKRCVLELINLNVAKTNYDNETLLLGDATKDVTAKYKVCRAMHKFWTTKRANFLWELRSSRIKASNILLTVVVPNDKYKALVFSKRTEQVEQICTHTYHAKNKKDNTTLEDLSSGLIRAAGVVQAVNRGVNLVGITHIIKESYDGSATTFQQQHGRGTRLAVTDVMSMLILVPYYRNKDGVVKPTQAYKWAKDMTSDFTDVKEEWI